LVSFIIFSRFFIIIVISNFDGLNFTILIIIEFSDLFFQFTFIFFVHVKSVEFSLLECVPEFLHEEVCSHVSPDDEDAQMGYDNVTDDFSANNFVADRLLHFLDLDKVDDSAWYKSNTKLIQEVQHISKVIHIRPHHQNVNAHNQL
jgi:hypothetical protein